MLRLIDDETEEVVIVTHGLQRGQYRPKDLFAGLASIAFWEAKDEMTKWIKREEGKDDTPIEIPRGEL